MHEVHSTQQGRPRLIVMGAGVALLVAASTTGLIINASDGGSSTSHAAARPPSRVAPTVSTPTSPAAQGSLLPVGDVSRSTTTPKASGASETHKAKPGTTAKTVAGKSKKITYVVKPGDNLTVIAAWFHQHGYGGLYELNKAVIGDNPSLILVGQRITITRAGAMTVSH